MKKLFVWNMMLTDRLEWCGLFWCFYHPFGLSFWRHPFTADDPLMSRWCNAKFLQILRIQGEKICLWVNFQQIFMFAWTILLSIHYPYIILVCCMSHYSTLGWLLKSRSHICICSFCCLFSHLAGLVCCTQTGPYVNSRVSWVLAQGRGAHPATWPSRIAQSFHSSECLIIIRLLLIWQCVKSA